MKAIKPQAGQTWRGKISQDILIDILSVNKKIDTIYGSPRGTNDVIDYVLSTFTDYYQFDVRPLSVIARDIEKHWRPVWFGAVPYLEAMRTLDDINENYYADSAESVVLYFLANAATWRGQDAKRIKAELKALCTLAK